MFNTPRFSVRSVVTGAAIAALMAGAVVPAANAAVPVVKTEEPVQAITQPISNMNASPELNEYTHLLGENLLTGGPDFVPAPNGLELDANAYNLSNALLNGYDRSVGDAVQRINGILVAPVINGDQYKIVLVNSNTAYGQLTEPFTGKSVIIAPNSAIIVDGYLLKGAIKSKLWALGGTNVVGFPTGVEYNTTNGNHAGATLVAVQKFSNNGSISEIQWTSAYGAHHIKGAIYGLYNASAGVKHNGAVKTDEYKFTVNGKQYVYLDAERARFRYDPATGQTVRLAVNAR